MSENRNLIVAMALSLAVLIGWQYFIAGPKMEKTRAAQEAAQAQATAAAQPVTTTYTPAQIDQWVAPIALYPDNLLYKLVKEKSRHVLRKLRRGSHDLPFRPDKKP